jgi:hypothetical protein
LSHLALRALRAALLVLMTVSCRVEPPQEIESDCHMEAPPAPGEAGFWGPQWSEDAQGAPELLVVPLAGAELWMDVRVTLADGREIRWTEDLPHHDGEPFSVPLTLPPELDDQPARVRVRLTAIHPETGRAIGHQAARGHVLRQGDRVQLLDLVPLEREISP